MTLPTLAHAHVMELRAAVSAGVSGETSVDEHEALRIRDLEAHGLLVWDAGAGRAPSGAWVRLRPGQVVATTAGHAALAFYELGLVRAQADAMVKL